MAQEFAGRVALVTGGAKNIGRAIALAFADAGADVAVVANSSVAEAEAVAAEARSRGVEARCFVADIGDPVANKALVADVEATLGPVSFLVNNASFRPRQPFLDISVEDWNRVIATNISGVFFLCQNVLGGMRDRGFGRIIMIGGPDHVHGSVNRAHNVASKSAIRGLMKSVSVEFGKFGVTSNTVAPGITDTTRNLKDYPHWPYSQEQLNSLLRIPRLGTSEEIADACIFLCSDKASYITGQTIHVDGGYVMP